jgi:thioredoxin 1
VIKLCDHLKMKSFSGIVLLLLIPFVPSWSKTAPKFSLEKSRLTVTPGGATKVRIRTFIPDKNHIYVEHTGPSFNILTNFSANTPGWVVEIAKRPKSERYEQDLILRGKGLKQSAGNYELLIYETQGRQASAITHNVELVIRTQMCNSKTNICYRPKTMTKTLKINVSGAKLSKKSRSSSSQKLSQSSGINWIFNYDEAMNKAKETGQNIFVVITAPSWCGYCKVLDKNVFSKAKVADVLNKKFIPLRILDTNPDNEKFQYSGFPTMFLFDAKGAKIKEVYNRKQQTFLGEIAGHELKPGSPINNEVKEEIFEYQVNSQGTFNRKGKVWTRIENGRETSYKEESRDESYIILLDQDSGEYLALPIEKGTGYEFKNGKWVEAFQFN